MSIVHPLYAIGGSDISIYQTPITWEVFAPKLDYLIIRLGDAYCRTKNRPDLDGIDSKFADNWAKAKLHGLPIGSYYYFRPDVSTVWQANKIISTLGNDWGEKGFYLDLETNSGLDEDSYTDQLISMLNKLDAACLQYTGKLCGLYSSWGFWNDNVQYTRIPRLAERPKWVSQYPYGTERVKPTAIPNGWKNKDSNGKDNLIQWQFSCTGSKPYGDPNPDGHDWGVYSRGLDLDVVLIPTEEWDAYFLAGTTPPPDEPPVPPEYTIPTMIKTRGYINVRSTPNDNNYTNLIGMLKPNFGPLPVIEAVDDAKGRGKWFKITDGMYVAGWLVKEL